MADLDKGCTRMLISVCKANGLLRNQAAYVLATAFHETAGTMRPVRETLASTSKSAIARLDIAWNRGKLPWVSKPYWRDGFFGRGFVQLTHEYNYEKAGRKLGVDFVTNPDLVMEPDYAAKIIVTGMKEGWFTGKKLSNYITLRRSDFHNARRIVNGMDKSALIAGYARDYDDALKAIGYGEEPAQKPAGKQKRIPPSGVQVVTGTLFALILAGLAAGWDSVVNWFERIFT